MLFDELHSELTAVFGHIPVAFVKLLGKVKGLEDSLEEAGWTEDEPDMMDESDDEIGDHTIAGRIYDKFLKTGKESKSMVVLVSRLGTKEAVAAAIANMGVKKEEGTRNGVMEVAIRTMPDVSMKQDAASHISREPEAQIKSETIKGEHHADRKTMDSTPSNTPPIVVRLPPSTRPHQTLSTHCPQQPTPPPTGMTFNPFGDLGVSAQERARRSSAPQAFSQTNATATPPQALSGTRAPSTFSFKVPAISKAVWPSNGAPIPNGSPLETLGAQRIPSSVPGQAFQQDYGHAVVSTAPLAPMTSQDGISGGSTLDSALVKAGAVPYAAAVEQPPQTNAIVKIESSPHLEEGEELPGQSPSQLSQTSERIGSVHPAKSEQVQPSRTGFGGRLYYMNNSSSSSEAPYTPPPFTHSSVVARRPNNLLRTFRQHLSHPPMLQTVTANPLPELQTYGIFWDPKEPGYMKMLRKDLDGIWKWRFIQINEINKRLNCSICAYCGKQDHFHSKVENCPTMRAARGQAGKMWYEEEERAKEYESRIRKRTRSDSDGADTPPAKHQRQ